MPLPLLGLGVLAWLGCGGDGVRSGLGCGGGASRPLSR
jgi:hypothetical protein